MYFLEQSGIFGECRRHLYEVLSVVLETFCYDPKWMLCASDDIFSSAPSMILAFENPHAGLVGNWGVPASTSMRLRKPSLNPLSLQSVHLHLWLQ
ncbi:hypothetical protein LOK49_LG13G03017 [Camellia lanceoleosa]|uniref:Uncharacterized protein n=1 Tax=Camellia lanceoleosa TaxID=1840588 RepID=A0ACC0FG89_9ERIC|nr:hypothetical protein LOK49_LG13G03017 [Camellia lanceoleosa]